MLLLLIVNLAGKLAALATFRGSPWIAAALWFVPDLLIGYHLLVPWAQGLVRMHRRFRTTEREVWLTIDDGPDPEDTPRLLALLAAHDARATFFVIGENAARHPELVRALTAAGHEVAHHTHTHPLATFWYASPARVAHELDDALEVLRQTGVHPSRFRSPAGIKNLWLARALKTRGLTGIGWSARGLESRSDEVAAVAQRVLRGLKPGSILLMHEGPRVPSSIRVAAVQAVLERLRELGYRCVVPRADQLGD